MQFKGLVIGLRAKRKSGKDFITDNILIPKFGAKRYSYAQKLREVVYEQYLKPHGISFEHTTNPKLKEKPLTHYPVMPGDQLSRIICAYFDDNFPMVAEDGGVQQYWSTRMLMIAEGQFKRSVNPYYWSDIVHRQIMDESPEIAVITDVRFPVGEARIIKQLGGKIVHVKRSLENRGIEKEFDDPSETAMDSWSDYDAVWDNDGTLRDIEKQVSHTMAYIFRSKV